MLSIPFSYPGLRFDVSLLRLNNIQCTRGRFAAFWPQTPPVAGPSGAFDVYAHVPGVSEQLPCQLASFSDLQRLFWRCPLPVVWLFVWNCYNHGGGPVSPWMPHTPCCATPDALWSWYTHVSTSELFNLELLVDKLDELCFFYAPNCLMNAI